MNKDTEHSLWKVTKTLNVKNYIPPIQKHDGIRIYEEDIKKAEMLTLYLANTFQPNPIAVYTIFSEVNRV